MDTILYNANIYTMDEVLPKAEAIAIQSDSIVAIGKNDEILNLKSKNTVLLDLKGQTILPGFNDSHLHLYMTGELLGWISLIHINSKKETLTILKNKVQTISDDEIFIMGHGWNQDCFLDDASFLTKSDLDQVTKDYPVILYRVCGHIATLNSKALEVFGITEENSDSQIDYDSGILYESALDIITKRRPQPTLQDVVTTLKRAIAHANQHGITSVQTDDFFNYPNGHKIIVDAYQELIKRQELTLRVYEQSLIPSLDSLHSFIQEGYFTGCGNNLFQIGPIKIIGDGSLGARTAALKNAYQDDPENKGILYYDSKHLYKFMKTAHDNNFQLAIHAIGDMAMEQLLTLFTKVLEESPKGNHRHGIVHCQIMDEDQIKKMALLNLVAYIQPIFVHSDQRMIEARVGKNRAKTSYAFKSMLDSQVKVAMGTDSPIESLSPLENIYCAVTRKTLEGNSLGWNTDEALSVHEAVKIYTKDASYASFEETQKGVLKVGYLADLVVLDQDIFTIKHDEIKNTKVNMTLLGGNIVYKRSIS